ncbi:MAG: carbon storage regulator CsrA [Calditrichia bacterium]
MLVLTRKQGEGITIGEDIKIFVIDVKGKYVRLGIEAPKCFIIHRDEIHAKIMAENRLAASPDADKVNEIIKSFKRMKIDNGVE